MKSTGGPGWAAAIAALQKKVAAGGSVRVGFFENVTYPDGKSAAQVAAYNEFGTATAPSRPFMRNAIAEHKDGWGELLANFLVATDFDVDKALAMCAEKMGAQIQDEIRSTTTPPNSPLTNLLKSRFPKGVYSKDEFLKAVRDLQSEKTAAAGRPLVWSGDMLQAVSYEIKDNIKKIRG